MVGDTAYMGERLRRDLSQRGHPLVHAARARPDDVASHRAPGPLVHHEDEPSYDDMTIELRRFIIAARFRGHVP